MRTTKRTAEIDRYTDYDRFAWFYNRHWGAEYHRQTLPILERLALESLQHGAAILDLCCGTGRVSAELLRRGFRVAGVEGSAEMLRYARENAPGAEFILGDARAFSLDGRFDLAISVFESLNHIMSVEELRSVFANVYRSLRTGGQFLFDLNREPAFEKYWNGPHLIVEDEHVWASRSRYCAEQKIAHCEITMFRLDREWRRSDVTISQRCHCMKEVEEALQEAGFSGIEAFDSRGDLGMTGDIALARTFFRCRRA